MATKPETNKINSMPKFRKKPVVIEAFQLSYEQAKGRELVPDWFVSAEAKGEVQVYVTDKIHDSQYCEIKTLEGVMTASLNDWIIQGVNGEIYPCKPDIFDKTYEPA